MNEDNIINNEAEEINQEDLEAASEKLDEIVNLEKKSLSDKELDKLQEEINTNDEEILKEKRNNTGEEKKYRYNIRDKNFGEFFVLNSANAWWIHLRKVEDLIGAFKIGASVEEACVYAGITIAQWNYFLQKHPEFSNIKLLLQQLPTYKARKTVHDNLGSNPDLALKYLERKRKKEFSTKVENELSGGLEVVNKYDKLSDEELEERIREHIRGTGKEEG